jgi:hypothetical protein
MHCRTVFRSEVRMGVEVMIEDVIRQKCFILAEVQLDTLDPRNHIRTKDPEPTQLTAAEVPQARLLDYQKIRELQQEKDSK